MAAGVTNAAPIGGGLKVIASGRNSNITSSITIPLPSPAAVVIINFVSADYGSSSTAALLPREDDAQLVGWLNGVSVFLGSVRLSSDGTTIFIEPATPSCGIDYLALG